MPSEIVPNRERRHPNRLGNDGSRKSHDWSGNDSDDGACGIIHGLNMAPETDLINPPCRAGCPKSKYSRVALLIGGSRINPQGRHQA